MADEQWRIEVDRETCIGSGMCVGMAPDYFELDGGRSRPLRETIEPDESVVDAAESCPVEAILVRGASTDQVIAPKV